MSWRTSLPRRIASPLSIAIPIPVPNDKGWRIDVDCRVLRRELKYLEAVAVSCVTRSIAHGGSWCANDPPK